MAAADKYKTAVQQKAAAKQSQTGCTNTEKPLNAKGYFLSLQTNNKKKKEKENAQNR